VRLENQLEGISDFANLEHSCLLLIDHWINDGKTEIQSSMKGPHQNGSNIKNISLTVNKEKLLCWTILNFVATRTIMFNDFGVSRLCALLAIGFLNTGFVNNSNLSVNLALN
jgi:hypothetical protein